MNRKTFLSLATAASMRVSGANDRIRVGLIGSGLRGKFLLGEFVDLAAEVAAKLARLPEAQDLPGYWG